MTDAWDSLVGHFDSFGTVAGGITAALALFALLRRGWVRGVRPRLRMFDEIAFLLQGRAAIVLPEDPATELSPGLPGALTRLQAIEQTQAVQAAALDSVQTDVTTIKAELSTNGGSSLRDLVEGIQTKVDALSEAS